MPLAEQYRAKLDTIVSKMEAAGETDDEIRAVIADFKGKYEGAQEIAQPAPGPSVMQKLAPLSSAMANEPQQAHREYNTSRMPSSFADMSTTRQNPAVVLAPAMDALSLPSRALAATRGMDMSDPSAYLLRPEAEQLSRNVEAQNAANPWKGGQPNSFADFGRNASDVPFGMAMQVASDPLSYVAPAGMAAKQIGKYGAKKLTAAAEKSILEKYSMAQARKLAPTIGTGREIQLVEDAQKAIPEASKIMAEKLREYDLLYNPGKANFNLNRDLRTYGKQIGETVQEMKARDVSVNLNKVLADYAAERLNAVKATGKGVGSIEDFQSKVIPKLQAMVDNLGHDGAGNVPIDKAVAFRQELQDMVKNWGQEAGGPLVQRVAKELQYRANQAIKASDKVGGPKLAELNEKFADLKGIQPLIEDAYSRGFGRSAVGRDTRPLPFTREGIVNRLYETAGSPAKALMNARPSMADKWANRGRQVAQDAPQQIPASTVTPEDVAALKAPFLPSQGEGLAPRRPMQRRPLVDAPPTYTKVRNDAAPELPPRRPTQQAPGTRRPLGAANPELDVSELAKVIDADAAKSGAKYQYRLERIKSLWAKVKTAKTEKEKTALMNLIRATQNAKD